MTELPESSGTVGVVGIGRMGHGMAVSLVRSGFPVTFIVHHSRRHAEALSGHGCREMPTLRALVDECDVLLLSLPSSTEVGQVLSVVETSQGPRQRLILDHHDLAAVRDQAVGRARATKQTWAHLVAMLLSPGGPPKPRRGVWSRSWAETPARGPLQSASPQPTASTSSGSAPQGAAHTLKLLNNMLSIGHACLAVEVMRAAESHGIDRAELRDIASLGAARSAAFAALVSFREGDDSVLNYSIASGLKDLNYAAATFDFDRWSAVIAAARAMLQQSCSEGLGQLNMPGLLPDLHMPSV